jgi:hypothetical protein
VDDDVDLKNYRAFSQYKSNLARAKERKRGGLYSVTRAVEKVK